METAHAEVGMIVVMSHNNILLKGFEGLLFKFAHEFS